MSGKRSYKRKKKRLEKSRKNEEVLELNVI